MINKKMIELRDNKTKTSVADDLGITRQMLGAIESGKRNPSLKLAQKIADYYGVSIEEIFFEEKGHDMLPKQYTGTDG
ncbi:helix-turn-helix transcriptional regulator [Syntrophomonas wolfei]|uniref:helix-turn-helix transcriptional regulator n=1 Tax=Syntrophomonas wolfei TaxID=863 RepID=UPI0023F1F839|nr:helix-turn-helix transcriptional regulator [Syntrophomonas wolfei]